MSAHDCPSAVLINNDNYYIWLPAAYIYNWRNANVLRLDLYYWVRKVDFRIYHHSAGQNADYCDHLYGNLPREARITKKGAIYFDTSVF